MASLLHVFGTEDPQLERRLLRAGPLEATLEDGNLRAIRYHGVEVLRAINYLCRTTTWATLSPTITNLSIREGETHFSVSYDAICEAEGGRYAYTAHIEGQASGGLSFEADGEAITNFATNRTGFVVLHPAAVAGTPLSVEHTNGRHEETAFPDLIMANQPVFDIRTLTHQAAPGLSVSTRMEGDAYEMEDQRNWTDASFKTYVRPLAKPYPFLIAAGERTRQAIRVTIGGQVEGADAGASGHDAALGIGAVEGRMPDVAAFLEDDAAPARSVADRLQPIQWLFVRVDLRAASLEARLAEARDLAATAGARLALEVVMPARDAAGEAEAVAGHLRSVGLAPDAIAVAAARDFHSRPSGLAGEGEVPFAALVEAVRTALPGVPVGGGTPSNFTEFNRNPPDGPIDFIMHGSTAVVHAGDDISVMETLEAFPAMVRSARALVPGKPYWLGPVTIGMRHNPYGASVAANPGNGRVAMAGADPRQRGRFAAAFLAGAAVASAGVEGLIVGAPTGDFGLFDEAGQARPVQAVAAILAAAAGKPRRAVATGHAGLLALGWDMGGGMAVLVANITAESRRLTVPTEASVAAIDAGAPSVLGAGETLAIEPYDVALLTMNRP